MAAMLPNGADLLRVLPDPFLTTQKLTRITCPLLVREMRRPLAAPALCA